MILETVDMLIERFLARVVMDVEGLASIDRLSPAWNLGSSGHSSGRGVSSLPCRPPSTPCGHRTPCPWGTLWPQ